jgi:hypothetical protein
VVCGEEICAVDNEFAISHSIGNTPFFGKIISIK